MDQDLLHAGRLFATSLGIGLLVGLERERKGDSRGLRTFAMVSLLGTLFAVLAERLAMPLLVPVGLIAIVAMSIAAYWHDHRRAPEPPTTSTISVFLGSTWSSQGMVPAPR
jgi:hypothetical protein